MKRDDALPPGGFTGAAARPDARAAMIAARCKQRAAAGDPPGRNNHPTSRRTAPATAPVAAPVAAPLPAAEATPAKAEADELHAACERFSCARVAWKTAQAEFVRAGEEYRAAHDALRLHLVEGQELLGVRQRTVVEWLRAHPGPHTVTQIRFGVGARAEPARQLLHRMKKAGLVRTVALGTYVLTEEPPARDAGEGEATT